MLFVRLAFGQFCGNQGDDGRTGICQVVYAIKTDSERTCDLPDHNFDSRQQGVDCNTDHARCGYDGRPAVTCPGFVFDRLIESFLSVWIIRSCLADQTAVFCTAPEQE